MQYKVLLTILFIAAPSLCFGDWRIGVIMTGDIPYYNEMHEAFMAEFEKRVPSDQKFEIILQRPFPDPIAWSNVARKFIAVDVDLIVTYGSPATLAVLHEKSSIPVVYAGVYDPEQSTYSGPNVTGCGFKVPLSSLLRYFTNIKKVKTINVVFSGIEEDSIRQKKEMQELTARQNIRLLSMDIRSRGDIEQLRQKSTSDAVFLTGSSLVHLWLEDILDITRKEKIPVSDIFPDRSQAGVLLSLYQPAGEQGKKAAEKAARILAGEKPSVIDMEVMRKTELVLNLVEAGQIDITFPIQLLVEATEIIK